MSRRRQITATELAECSVCERRVLLDRLRGKRRTPQSLAEMAAGEAVHRRLDREAQQQLQGRTDRRCFVATALWGATDARTKILREWRDRWLLKRTWGPIAVELYYRHSPTVVECMRRSPRLRALVDAILTLAVRLLTFRRP
jgi:hypothetical protein